MVHDGLPRAKAARPASSVVAPPAFGPRGDALVCFSHLRWDFVFQRPQHLMTRFAASRRVVVFEEPLPAGPGEAPRLEIRTEPSGVAVATPRLAEGLAGAERDTALTRLLDGMVAELGIQNPILWYYTPMMLGFSRPLTAKAAAVVYDCMDELSNFRFAPPELKDLELELVGLADVVFTGGYSLYEAKRGWSRNIHPFPSSVDRAHFAAARTLGEADAPGDQAALPRPRLGFYGVIDERMDAALLAELADAHPEWSIVMVGPAVKIDPADLPRRANLHYLGGRSYDELPAYLSGWDVALMPFAINESTRFISPTKTPEYLAGGRPVVSTAVVDVDRHYGGLEAVKVAASHAEFVRGCEEAMALARAPERWLPAVDEALAELSWDTTQQRMSTLVDEAILRRSRPGPAIGAPATFTSSRPAHYDYLIVGAGFAGSVLAERLAAASNKKVLVIDRRPHIAGNAYDRHDEAGVLTHQYGPHIFHTNSEAIVRYLSRFTAWRPYEHRVLASVGDELLPFPINRTTLNRLYGLDLASDAEAEAFLKSRAEPVETIRTSEDAVVAAVGRELYETFFRGYTRKQWGLDPSALDRSVTSRVPARASADDRYFTDSFQSMPRAGYTAMFENMLDHRNITLELATAYDDVKGEAIWDRLVFTGPIDEFFGRRYGPLPYRSLKFRHETLDQEQFQPVATVNYPSPDVPYTRISEYKHLTGQKHARTTITYEYPSAEGDPYYPVPRTANQALYKRYEALALDRPDVSFVGRLASYRYYNMDQVVGQALAVHRRLAEQEARGALVAGRDAGLAASA